ncbi:hypothetical protein ACOM2C_17055 [Pseudarthrobacter sp. So.54]
MTTHDGGYARPAAAAPRDFRPGRPMEPEWTELLESLWRDRDLLVKDFLARFSAVSYGDALVPPEDVYQTAADTMDMFLFQMAGLPLPADLQALPREVASRRARQGVPLDAFLEAIRNDFRVLWKGLERVAGTTGIGVLVANMDRVLDAVEGYVSSIQQAYAEEEARLARNKQLYRQRLLSRLFNADLGGPAEVRELAAALGVQAAGSFEVLAVTAESVAQAQRQSDHRIYAYENSRRPVPFPATAQRAHLVRGGSALPGRLRPRRGGAGRGPRGCRFGAGAGPAPAPRRRPRHHGGHLDGHRQADFWSGNFRTSRRRSGRRWTTARRWNASACCRWHAATDAPAPSRKPPKSCSATATPW